MSISDARIKHLEMIQNVISRISKNSFAVKSITITLATAALGLAASIKKPEILFASIPQVLIFWGLDAYFLRCERAFRCLFDKERVSTEAPTFSMNPKSHNEIIDSWFRTLFSTTIFWLYVPLLILIFWAWWLI